MVKKKHKIETINKLWHLPQHVFGFAVYGENKFA